MDMIWMVSIEWVNGNPKLMSCLVDLGDLGCQFVSSLMHIDAIGMWKGYLIRDWCKWLKLG